MKKQLLSVLLVLVMVFAMVPAMMFSADAASDVVLSTKDARLNAMLDAISNQNFSGAKATAVQAKQYMRHFIFDSSFAAINGGYFNYPNAGPYCYHVTDGTYSADIRGSTGCCAYSYFVSKVVYGTEANDNKLYLKTYTADALKQFLTSYAQAGEHLRAGSTHSVTFISCNASGFYCLSYCGDNSPKIRLEYWTFADFLRFYSGNQIYLYNANFAQNSNSETDWMPVISTSDLSYPTKITYGSGFNLEGIISTNVGSITTVNGYVTDSVGNVVMEKVVNPNTQSYNLNSAIDSALKFGKLDIDTYTYHLYAEAANGDKTSSASLVDQVFTVAAGGSDFYIVKTQKCGFVINIPANYKLPYCNNSETKNINGYMEPQKEAYALSSTCRYVMSDGTIRFETYDNSNKIVYAVFNLNDSMSYQIVHDFKPVKVTEPTCEESGSIEYKCECGATKTDIIAAVGHNISGGKCLRCDAEIENPFDDLKNSDEYYDAVLWAYYHKPVQITGGKDATHFDPKGNCTRAQVVTFLYRAAGEPEPIATSNPYKDVDSNAYYYKAILWAAENEITKGYGNGLFKPNDTVTRAQFVTFLWRYLGEPEASSDVNPFTDVASSSSYYNAILWAVEANVTKGYGNNDFRPDQTCTRWNVVLFLYRAMNQVL